LAGRDPADLRRHVERRLHGTAPGGDPFDVWSGDLSDAQIATLRQHLPAQLARAAVLVPLVERPEGLTVLLTQRASHLKNHAGQISFPGGRVEEGDQGPAHTALREAQEEVGIDPAGVEILGELPDYHTSTGYRVRPVVGWAEPPIAYAPDPSEVADVFEVPLAFLLETANHRYESAFYKGRLRHYWAMPWQGRFIWGATAGMLVTFQRIVGRCWRGEGRRGAKKKGPAEGAPNSTHPVVERNSTESRCPLRGVINREALPQL